MMWKQAGQLMGSTLGKVSIGSAEAKLQGVAMHHIAIVQASQISKLPDKLDQQQLEDLEISVTSMINFYREQCANFEVSEYSEY